MAYVDPRMVTSPRGRVSDVKVIVDEGEDKFSVVQLKWDGEPAVGVRWNGGSEGSFPGIGNPQSRGIPTWFILPEPVADLVKAHQKSLGR